MLCPALLWRIHVPLARAGIAASQDVYILLMDKLMHTGGLTQHYARWCQIPRPENVEYSKMEVTICVLIFFFFFEKEEKKKKKKS